MSPDAADREKVRRAEIDRLRSLAAPGGTVWSRYNLTEVLPEPTPMTWAIVDRLLSGRGGLGLMYRDLGCEPARALDDQSTFDLICGRPYCNLSREPLMQFSIFPFEHSFAELRAHPQQAFYPRAKIKAERTGLGFWLRLPWNLFKISRFALRVRRISGSFDQHLERNIVPHFLQAVRHELAEDFTLLTTQQVLERLQIWAKRTVVDFAREAFKPTALAGIALGNLERVLTGILGPERTRSALVQLSQGAGADPSTDLPKALTALAAGRLKRQTFLEQFGNRGPMEMELSQPRWSEDASSLDRLPLPASHGAIGPSALERWEKIADEGKLSTGTRASLTRDVNILHTYLGLRESAKHQLMKGHAQIRRLLLELDRRFSLANGIFFLTPDELPRLIEGENLTDLIAERRRYRELALAIHVPTVIFSDDLEAIGRAASPCNADDKMQGTPVSDGTATGSALVLTAPDVADLPDKPFILVCPSTDPAWVPLFTRAAGVVLETGGVLSHGAIVAREFGLPAVAGIPDITQRIRTGQRLRVDGSTGLVEVTV
jgi:pyruvate,water dikinase